MSAALPLRLDPLKAADQGRSYHATIPLVGLGRLVDALAANGGDVECDFAFYRDTDGRRKLKLSYRSDLVLRCERCLGPLDYRVEGENVLRLVDAAMEVADEDEDVLQVGDDGIRLHDVIEDELLLALPLIPRHTITDDCAPEALRWLKETDADAAIETQTANPFDILKKLKH
ncbi:YceD family protein [Acidihalobacter ferrooxydans]|uniref:Large ribosomal RNA subunit accumulation protein YceD n=1 Tax=Acidihalobacter ferrooxydans TaxID=1765967 RepID=A0A1P8UFP6_9GAMM|nr:YceD family protein [Acidihalobacter ferrooxydans]APZ42666.1 hypothetical protein BW247_05760 [Acidihalobacter ferrooxydans]